MMDSIAEILRFKFLGIPVFIFIVALLVPLLVRNKQQEINKETDDYTKDH